MNEYLAINKPMKETLGELSTIMKECEIEKCELVNIVISHSFSMVSADFERILVMITYMMKQKLIRPLDLNDR